MNYGNQSTTGTPTLTSNDFNTLGCDSTGGAFTVDLPDLTTVTLAAGTVLVVEDEGGHANGSNITITPFSGQKINRSTNSVAITSRGGAYRLYTDGNNWFSW